MQPGEVVAAAFHVLKTPVPVQSATGGSISSWITAISVVVGFLGLWLGVWPKLKALSNARLDSLDDERRGDMATMRLDIASLTKEVKEAAKEAHTAKNQLATAVMAITLLTSWVRQHSVSGADDPILAQVNDLMKAALSDDMGFSDGIAKIIAAGISG